MYLVIIRKCFTFESLHQHTTSHTKHLPASLKTKNAMSTITAVALQQEVKKALKVAFGTTSISKAKAALKAKADEWGSARVVAGGFIFLFTSNKNCYASYIVRWAAGEEALDKASFTKAGLGRLHGTGLTKSIF